MKFNFGSISIFFFGVWRIFGNLDRTIPFLRPQRILADSEAGDEANFHTLRNLPLWKILANSGASDETNFWELSLIAK